MPLVARLHRARLGRDRRPRPDQVPARAHALGDRREVDQLAFGRERQVAAAGEQAVDAGIEHRGEADLHRRLAATEARAEPAAVELVDDDDLGPATRDRALADLDRRRRPTLGLVERAAVEHHGLEAGLALERRTDARAFVGGGGLRLGRAGRDGCGEQDRGERGDGDGRVSTRHPSMRAGVVHHGQPPRARVPGARVPASAHASPSSRPPAYLAGPSLPSSRA